MESNNTNSWLVAETGLAQDGYLCRLCGWSTRPQSTSLMDMPTITNHAIAQHHLQSDQLSEYLQNGVQYMVRTGNQQSLINQGAELVNLAVRGAAEQQRLLRHEESSNFFPLSYGLQALQQASPPVTAESDHQAKRRKVLPPTSKSTPPCQEQFSRRGKMSKSDGGPPASSRECKISASQNEQSTSNFNSRVNGADTLPYLLEGTMNSNYQLSSVPILCSRLPPMGYNTLDQNHPTEYDTRNVLSQSRFTSYNPRLYNDLSTWKGASRRPQAEHRNFQNAQPHQTEAAKINQNHQMIQPSSAPRGNDRVTRMIIDNIQSNQMIFGTHPKDHPLDILSKERMAAEKSNEYLYGIPSNELLFPDRNSASADGNCHQNDDYIYSRPGGFPNIPFPQVSPQTPTQATPASTGALAHMTSERIVSYNNGYPLNAGSGDLFDYPDLEEQDPIDNYNQEEYSVLVQNDAVSAFPLHMPLGASVPWDRGHPFSGESNQQFDNPNLEEQHLDNSYDYEEYNSLVRKPEEAAATTARSQISPEESVSASSDYGATTKLGNGDQLVGGQDRCCNSSTQGALLGIKSYIYDPSTGSMPRDQQSVSSMRQISIANPFVGLKYQNQSRHEFPTNRLEEECREQPQDSLPFNVLGISSSIDEREDEGDFSGWPQPEEEYYQALNDPYPYDYSHDEEFFNLPDSAFPTSNNTGTKPF